MYSKNEVLQFVQENDVKFVRLTFCDVFGKVKNIAIMTEELPKALEEGFRFYPATIDGFGFTKESVLYLHPDVSTISILPWRPQNGRVIRFYCDIKKGDGTYFEADSRNILRKATLRAEKMGYYSVIGTDCEFYLFETDEKGKPTMIPQDEGEYLDIAPIDKGENIRRDICLTLESLGIVPYSSHHEKGPGQNEIDFKHSDGIIAADNFVNFRLVVKAIAERNGVYASFMPKPLADKIGSGLLLDIKFKSIDQNEKLNEVRKMFIAGIFNRMREITAFLNPTINSYERLYDGTSPKAIIWSRDNVNELIRVIGKDESEFRRMKLRSADPTCNPYLAFALLINAGLDGIENKESLPPMGKKQCDDLPKTLLDAVNVAEQSDFVKKSLTEELLNCFVEREREIYIEYEKAVNKEKFIRDLYFKKV
jgi:glutamine synthetase